MQTVKKVEVEQRGTYSVYYSHEDSLDQFVLDWDFNVRGEWSVTVKDYGGVQWFKHAEKDEKMHEVLLAHFGLSEWKNEFPFDEIRRLSPRHLARERREKEKCFRCGVKIKRAKIGGRSAHFCPHCQKL